MTNFLDERTPEEISRVQVYLIDKDLPAKRVTPILELLGGNGCLKQHLENY